MAYLDRLNQDTETQFGGGISAPFLGHCQTEQRLAEFESK